MRRNISGLLIFAILARASRPLIQDYAIIKLQNNIFSIIDEIGSRFRTCFTTFSQEIYILYIDKFNFSFNKKHFLTHTKKI